MAGGRLGETVRVEEGRCIVVVDLERRISEREGRWPSLLEEEEEVVVVEWLSESSSWLGG